MERGKMPRLVFWETTSRCNLTCVHCRRTNLPEQGGEMYELPTAKFKEILASLQVDGKAPMVVFSGGEPLMRKDILELLGFAKEKGIGFALATNGALVDEAMAKKLAELGPHRVSVSLDGADAETHDGFRGVKGSFDLAVRALRLLKAAGIPTQINCSVSTKNAAQRDAVLKMALDLGASALHYFLLVPVGCGADLPESMRLGAESYEEFLDWLMAAQKKHGGAMPHGHGHPGGHPHGRPGAAGGLEIRATCAPHQTRIVRQKVEASSPEFQGRAAQMRGCLAGSAIAFISYKGEVFPCGYLPVPAGDLFKQGFYDIWNGSEVLKTISDPAALKGKCFHCGYRAVCGGCRARAYGTAGDYMGEEPYCLYEPGAKKAE